MLYKPSHAYPLEGSPESHAAGNALSLNNAALAQSNSHLQKRIGMLASHMSQQQSQHEQAMTNTANIFEQLLVELPRVCDSFKQAFAGRGIPAERIFHEVDHDRSVGILSVLWHTVTFTTRGNSKPLALHKAGKQPQFTGRIVAFHGDFHLLEREAETLDGLSRFQDLLTYEVCSLFVPGNPDEHALFTVKHLGNQPQHFHQMDAARLFLGKTLDMVCGGGYIHEQ